MADYSKYPWITPEWWEAARKAAIKTRVAMGARRWKKDDATHLYINDPYDPWPRVPLDAMTADGEPEPLRGQTVLPVWASVDNSLKETTDNDIVLAAYLTTDDAITAGVADKELYIVPDSAFLWVAGALSFDKTILTVLQDPIREHRMTVKDAEKAYEELVWIGPVSNISLPYHFLVLPLVKIWSRIDEEKSNPGIFAAIQRDPWRHFIWETLDIIHERGITRRGKLSEERNGQVELDEIRRRIIDHLRNLGSQFEDMEDFRQAGLSTDGTAIIVPARETCRYTWKDQEGEYHTTEWQICDGKFALDAALKVVNSGERYRHLTEEQRKQRELRLLEAGARNSIFVLRLQTETEALAGSGSVAKVIDQSFGCWIKEATEEDTLQHRKVFISAVYYWTAKESAHIGSVAELALTEVYHRSDPDNAPDPTKAATKAVLELKVRPGTTPQGLLEEARRYQERTLEEGHTSQEPGKVRKLVAKLGRFQGAFWQVAHRAIWVVDSLIGLLERLAIPLDAIGAKGQEFGLLEIALLATWFWYVMPIANKLFQIGVCWMLIIAVLGGLYVSTQVGNWVREQARGSFLRKIAFLALFGLIIANAIQGGRILNPIAITSLIKGGVSATPTPSPKVIPFGSGW